MADRIAFFGTIKLVEFPNDGTVVITLDGEQRLTVAQQLGPVLGELMERQWPVYLLAGELLDIERVLIPRIVRVETIEGSSVTFEGSHLRAEAANDEILRALHRAAETRESIAVTITDAFQVIDVRPFPGPPPGTGLPALPMLPALQPDDTVSPERAQELFDLCARTSCDPEMIPPPCIPFLYPDDGCWGRAHEMARLLIDAGASPRKVWIYGTLRTPTRNNPCCTVPWRFHVAPTIAVRVGRDEVEEQVVDPSLFTTPVSVATWAGVQGDPAATFVRTTHHIFSRFYDGEQLDPAYEKTNEVLVHFRLQLQARSLSIGPPPYICPPPQPCI
jgi:hypothetical protein